MYKAKKTSLVSIDLSALKETLLRSESERQFNLKIHEDKLLKIFNKNGEDISPVFSSFRNKLPNYFAALTKCNNELKDLNLEKLWQRYFDDYQLSSLFGEFIKEVNTDIFHLMFLPEPPKLSRSFESSRSPALKEWLRLRLIDLETTFVKQYFYLLLQIMCKSDQIDLSKKIQISSIDVEDGFDEKNIVVKFHYYDGHDHLCKIPKKDFYQRLYDYRHHGSDDVLNSKVFPPEQFNLCNDDNADDQYQSDERIKIKIKCQNLNKSFELFERICVFSKLAESSCLNDNEVFTKMHDQTIRHQFRKVLKTQWKNKLQNNVELNLVVEGVVNNAEKKFVDEDKLSSDFIALQVFTSCIENEIDWFSNYEEQQQKLVDARTWRNYFIDNYDNFSAELGLNKAEYKDIFVYLHECANLLHDVMNTRLINKESCRNKQQELIVIIKSFMQKLDKVATEYFYNEGYTTDFWQDVHNYSERCKNEIDACFNIGRKWRYRHNNSRRKICIIELLENLSIIDGSYTKTEDWVNKFLKNVKNTHDFREYVRVQGPKWQRSSESIVVSLQEQQELLKELPNKIKRIAGFEEAATGLVDGFNAIKEKVRKFRYDWRAGVHGDGDENEDEYGKLYQQMLCKQHDLSDDVFSTLLKQADDFYGEIKGLCSRNENENVFSAGSVNFNKVDGYSAWLQTISDELNQYKNDMSRLRTRRNRYNMVKALEQALADAQKEAAQNNDSSVKNYSKRRKLYKLVRKYKTKISQERSFGLGKILQIFRKKKKKRKSSWLLEILSKADQKFNADKSSMLQKLRSFLFSNKEFVDKSGNACVLLKAFEDSIPEDENGLREFFMVEDLSEIYNIIVLYSDYIVREKQKINVKYFNALDSLIKKILVACPEQASQYDSGLQDCCVKLLSYFVTPQNGFALDLSKLADNQVGIIGGFILKELKFVDEKDILEKYLPLYTWAQRNRLANTAMTKYIEDKVFEYFKPNENEKFADNQKRFNACVKNLFVQKLFDTSTTFVSRLQREVEKYINGFFANFFSGNSDNVEYFINNIPKVFTYNGISYPAWLQGASLNGNEVIKALQSLAEDSVQISVEQCEKIKRFFADKVNSNANTQLAIKTFIQKHVDVLIKAEKFSELKTLLMDIEENQNYIIKFDEPIINDALDHIIKQQELLEKLESANTSVETLSEFLQKWEKDPLIDILKRFPHFNKKVEEILKKHYQYFLGDNYFVEFDVQELNSILEKNGVLISYFGNDYKLNKDYISSGAKQQLFNNLFIKKEFSLLTTLCKGEAVVYTRDEIIVLFANAIQSSGDVDFATLHAELAAAGMTSAFLDKITHGFNLKQTGVACGKFMAECLRSGNKFSEDVGFVHKFFLKNICQSENEGVLEKFILAYVDVLQTSTYEDDRQNERVVGEIIGRVKKENNNLLVGVIKGVLRKLEDAKYIWPLLRLVKNDPEIIKTQQLVVQLNKFKNLATLDDFASFYGDGLYDGFKELDESHQQQFIEKAKFFVEQLSTSTDKKAWAAVQNFIEKANIKKEVASCMMRAPHALGYLKKDFITNKLKPSLEKAIHCYFAIKYFGDEEQKQESNNLEQSLYDKYIEHVRRQSWAQADIIYGLFVQVGLSKVAEFADIEELQQMRGSDKLNERIQLILSVKKLQRLLNNEESHSNFEQDVGGSFDVDKKYISIRKTLLRTANHILYKCKEHPKKQCKLLEGEDFANLLVLWKYLNDENVAGNLGLIDNDLLDSLWKLQGDRKNSEEIYHKLKDLFIAKRNKKVINPEEFSLSEFANQNLIFSDLEKSRLYKWCGQGKFVQTAAGTYPGFSSTKKMQRKLDAPVVGDDLSSASLEGLICRMLTKGEVNSEILECYNARLRQLVKVNKPEGVCDKKSAKRAEKKVRTKNKSNYRQRVDAFKPFDVTKGITNAAKGVSQFTRYVVKRFKK